MGVEQGLDSGFRLGCHVEPCPPSVTGPFNGLGQYESLVRT